MTYCVAMRLAEGLVCVSDSRTNAGVDHIAVFRKLHRFGIDGERLIVLQSAGNLATSQSVVTLLRQRINSDDGLHLDNVPTMFEAARLVGKTLREVLAHDDIDRDFSCSFLLSGQIAGEAPQLYNIYPQGNFIAATEDTPYFQIGESKYGKPILDRALNYQLSLEKALRCALISFDSTIRSNLSVGTPLDLLVYRHDSLRLPTGRRLYDDDPYWAMIRTQWSEGLKQAMASMPPPPEEYWV
ncbi:putative proteasome-type protease [Fluviicoccus keumensis]|uniref:Putative proteasome-type protease n=1 Tax=Fluviicoccus keumensis TaxID=1435465 RepID=A0A4Q7YPK9_9GAMM|nr:proteasome-type protease [Fluviicoccus keumensis]RZU38669.1 putative proteasome-type protease [Fluviicoccus keumensis]